MSGKIKEIVLSGGGTNAIAIVGSLQALYETGQLQTIDRWVGSSAGAIIAVFMVLGYTPQSLYKLLMNVDYSNLNDATCDSVLSFFDVMGVIDGCKIMQIVRLALAKKGFAEDTTFHELQVRSQKELVIAGYNLTEGVTEAFDTSNTPHMRVMVACRISISVPFLFTPVVHNGHMYVDGCTIEHAPIQFATHRNKSLIIQCVCQADTDPNTVSSANTRPIPNDVPSFCALLNSRVCRTLHEKCMSKIMKKRPHTILSIPIPRSNCATFVVDFAMDVVGKKSLFHIGHEAALHHTSMQ